MTSPTPNKLDPLADPEGMVLDASDLQASASTVLLCKQIADTLENHYPGWGWAVGPDERGGVINIYALRLSGKWGYLAHTKDIQDDPGEQMKQTIRIGGEILERFGMPRGRYSIDAWRAAPRRYGLLDFDISDKRRDIQRRHRDDALDSAVREGRVRIKFRDTETQAGTYRRIAVSGVE